MKTALTKEEAEALAEMAVASWDEFGTTLNDMDAVSLSALRKALNGEAIAELEEKAREETETIAKLCAEKEARNQAEREAIVKWQQERKAG